MITAAASAASGSRALNLLLHHQLLRRVPTTATTKTRSSSFTLPKGILLTIGGKRYASLLFCRQVHSSSSNEVAMAEDMSDTDFLRRKAAGGKPLLKHETVGAFQKLPMVMPAEDILSSAQRKARNVSATRGITNVVKREKNKGAKQVDALMKELAVPLRGYVENFPNKRSLHPYERSLIELTFGDGNYEQILERVDALRKRIVYVGKQHASLCAKSSSKREAEERLNEGLKRLEEAFKHGKHAVDDLLNVAKTLRIMPVVDPEIPTLCLIGAPNVGKSSLVRILSTGKPEVCSYPFTTRGILMGHIVLDCDRFQVTDTPGLLTRHDDDRNNIERLTIAVLSHLPTAVLYVHDLSGDCGTSPNDQYITYQDIKERFGDRLWLDVISKCDLLEQSSVSILDSDDEDLVKYKRFGPDSAIRVSVQSKSGVDELKQVVHQLLISQIAQIRSEKSKLESEGIGSSLQGYLGALPSDELSYNCEILGSS